ncbi:uncharacterized protein [Eucyclogobius newberryi]|uniref:uncharacterized protein n=1 Tax=Eucyclogobius newberryi TaxID=166745 RepID=UPI003B5B110E
MTELDIILQRLVDEQEMQMTRNMLHQEKKEQWWREKSTFGEIDAWEKTFMAKKKDAQLTEERMERESLSLENKVKVQQQERKNLYEGNEEAFLNRETALLRKNAELNKELTEKREQETNWMKDFAALKSQLAKRENQVLHSQREQEEKFRANMDCKMKSWFNEKEKFVGERTTLEAKNMELEDENRKLEDENRDLVMKIKQFQQDWSHTEIMLNSERECLKMQLAAIQKYSQQTITFSKVQTMTTSMKWEEPSSLKEKVYLKNKVALLNKLIEKRRIIENLKQQQSQLIVDNRQWQKMFKSCEKNNWELKKQYELGQKEKLTFQIECSKKNDQIETLHNKIVTLKENFATEKKINCKVNEQKESWAKEKLELQRDQSKNAQKIEEQQNEIKKQKNEIEKLKSKIEKLQENLITEQGNYCEKLQMQQTLNQQLELKEVKCQETFAKEQQKNRDLKHQQEIWEKAKSELERDCTQKEKNIKWLEDKNDTLQDQIEELQERLATELKKCRKTLDSEFKQQQEIWDKEKFGLERDCAQTIIKNKMLEERNDTLQDQIKELQERLATELKKCRKTLDSELKEQQEIWGKEKFGLETDCAQKAKKNKMLEDKNDTLQDQIEKLQERLATEQRRCLKNLDSELKQQQEICEKEKFGLESDCAEKHTKIKLLGDKNDTLQDQVKELQEMLATEQQKYLENLDSELRQQQEIFEKEQIKFQKRCTRKNKIIKDLQEKNYNLEDQIKKLLDKHATEQQDLQEDNFKQKNTIFELQEKISTQQEKMDCEFKQQEENWKKEKRELEEKIYKMDCQNARICKTLELERLDIKKQRQNENETIRLNKDDVWKKEKLKFENQMKEKELSFEQTLNELQKEQTELDLKQKHMAKPKMQILTAASQIQPCLTTLDSGLKRTICFASPVNTKIEDCDVSQSCYSSIGASSDSNSGGTSFSYNDVSPDNIRDTPKMERISENSPPLKGSAARFRDRFIQELTKSVQLKRSQQKARQGLSGHLERDGCSTAQLAREALRLTSRRSHTTRAHGSTAAHWTEERGGAPSNQEVCEVKGRLTSPDSNLWTYA